MFHSLTHQAHILSPLKQGTKKDIENDIIKARNDIMEKVIASALDFLKIFII